MDDEIFHREIDPVSLDPDIARAVDQAVTRGIYERTTLIEQACEAALVEGTCGVMVVDHGTHIDARPHPYVPYGRIYWFDPEALHEHVWTEEPSTDP